MGMDRGEQSRSRTENPARHNDVHVVKCACACALTHRNVWSRVVLPISLPFEHCVLRELMRTSLLIRDGLRKENAANLHRQTASH